MRIIIVGGSNSLVRNGWTKYLPDHFPGEIVNLSIGATTTLTGIYRLLQGITLQKGDVIVWEYAVNEIKHIERGYVWKDLLKYIEYMIKISRDAQAAFAPVIFTTKQEEVKAKRHPYFAGLIDLFATYGVAYFDLSREYRALHKVETAPEEIYRDAVHYAFDPILLNWIAGSVSDLAKRANIPENPVEIYTGGSRIHLLNDFADGVFENSLLSIPTASLPKSIQLPEGGRIAAAYYLTYPDKPSAIRISLLSKDGKEYRRLRLSGTNINGIRMPLLKSCAFEAGAKQEWQFAAGDRLRIRPAERGGKVYAEYETRASLPNQLAPYTEGFCGFLVETPGSAPSSTARRGFLDRLKSRLTRLV